MATSIAATVLGGVVVWFAQGGLYGRAVVSLLVYALIWIPVSMFCGWLWRTRGRSSSVGYVIALFFTPLLSLLAALVLGSDRDEIERAALRSGRFRKCPACAEAIRSEATRCRHCGQQVLAENASSPNDTALPGGGTPPRQRRQQIAFFMNIALLVSISILIDWLWTPASDLISKFLASQPQGSSTSNPSGSRPSTPSIDPRSSPYSRSGGNAQGQDLVVVPMLSIHGVKPGMSESEVRAALGKPTSTEKKAGRCELGSHTTYVYDGANGKFISLSLCKGMKNHVEYLWTDFDDWRTSEGVGVGSTQSEITTAYPKAICDGEDDGEDRGCLSGRRCSLHASDLYLDFYVVKDRVACVQHGTLAP